MCLLGTASLLAALLSYGLFPIGGLLAMPVWLALAGATWWTAWRRRDRSRWATAGVIVAGVVLLVGAYTLVWGGAVPTRLRTGSSVYSAGGHVRLKLSAGMRSLGYNLCGPTLERRTAGSWHVVQVDAGSTLTVCTAELGLLSPLLAAERYTQLPRDLPAGTYRLVHTVEAGSGKLRLATNAFAVTR